jgi:hypothetical protein
MKITEDIKDKERAAKFDAAMRAREAKRESETEEWRAKYLRRAKSAVEINKFIKEAPKPRFLARVRWWVGQLIPRRHWGVYGADGGYRIAVWKTWLGKTTKEIDVKMGY